jgi:hypothetical protein
MRLAAKDSRMWKIIVPLVMGFKTTGVLIFAISAVKMFLLKALMVSKIALLAAGFLVAKKLMSSMGAQQHPYQQHPYQQHPYLFAHQPLHYYNDHGLAGGLPTGYAYSNYATSGDHYGATTGHGFGASASEELAASATDDLQAHFSNNVLTSAQTSTANHTSAKKDGNN